MLGKPPVIGEMAQSHCSHFPKRVIYDVLKIFGKSMNEIQINSNWGFKLVNQNGIIYFEIESLEGLLSQEMVLAIFFKTMKAQAESHLNTTVQEINVLTDFKLSESQKLIFNCAAAKLNFEIIRFHFSL
uniref:DUF1828 domain-containing protein n=1 Tax=Panagrolaimus superbus TaxID=310955 RepID=A0A914YNH3_9BILA